MFRPGERIGDYVLRRSLGTGGMGQVFAAAHVVSGAPAAVKLLHPEWLDLRHVLARFRNEARAVAEQPHPGVVRIIEHGTLPSGVPYIVMEQLDATLREHLVERRALRQGEAARVGRQIAQALSAVHDRGVVHRDVKPGNLMFAESERRSLRVTDFGLAKVPIPSGKQQEALTADSAILGTPDYMAPEQLREPAAVTGHADVYALGVVLYEALSGRLPFVAPGERVLGMHLFEPPPQLRPVDPAVALGFRELVGRMLAKAPAERPCMAEVAAQLAAWEEPHELE